MDDEYSDDNLDGISNDISPEVFEQFGQSTNSASSDAQKKRYLYVAGAVLAVLILLAICGVVAYIFVISAPESVKTKVKPTPTPKVNESPTSSPTPTPAAVSPTPTPTPTPTPIPAIWNAYILPGWSKPSSYKIKLKTDLEQSGFVFNGDEEITLSVNTKSPAIILHAADLTIDSIKAKLHEDAEFDCSYELNDELEYLYIYRPQKQEWDTGDYHLTISFHGILNSNMKGFYRSSYLDDKGNTKWLGATQFEPVDARRAFPCFDEPSFKATFQLTLVVPHNLPAYANTPEKLRTTSQGKDEVTFEETPKMSTYLVAFAVGVFDSISSNLGNIPVRVLATGSQATNRGNFALSIAVNATEWYQGYFDYPYDLPKLDLMALPDFAAGAMENWGLITYRETALLLDPENDSAENRQRVAVVVAHELAHQWTGDLVTANWWNNLWLNEGFADFFETESLDGLLPDWKMRDQFISDDQQRAFETDALASTHPVQNNATTPEEISEIFDSITYSKGGSILRMIQAYMGKDNFRDGLRYHLKRLNHGNANTLDLFESLQHSFDGKGSFSLKFADWIQKPGFPLITVEWDQNQNQVLVKQKRFFMHQNPTKRRYLRHIDGENDGESQIWFVPLTYVYGDANGNQTSASSDLSFQEKEHRFSVPDSATWIKYNADQTGFFRVMYDQKSRDSLKKALKDKQITSATDRAGVLNDALVLARANLMPTSEALSLVLAQSDHERELVVWNSILSEILIIDHLLSTEICYGSWLKYMKMILQPIYTSIGWHEDQPDHTKALLTSTILRLSVIFDVGDARQVANQKFHDYVSPEGGSFNKPIPGNWRPAVFGAGILVGGETAYNNLFTYYMKEENAAIKKDALRAFGRTSQLYLLENTLKMCADNTTVRRQDISTCVAGVSYNELGRDLAWNWLQQNWKSFNEAGFGLTGLIAVTTSQFSDEYHRQEIEAFFERNPPNGGERTVQQVLEGIDLQIGWLDRNSKPVCEYLKTLH